MEYKDNDNDFHRELQESNLYSLTEFFKMSWESHPYPNFASVDGT